MRTYPKSVHEGKVYPTKDGDLIVDKYISSSEVLITFVNTGFSKTTTAGNINKGSVKDPYKPSVFGVGFLGNGKFFANSRRVRNEAYICWHNMLRRCYCPKEKERQPWYEACSVEPCWLNFQVFAKWYYENFKEGYELDKDMKVSGNKVYGPNTCQFVHPTINRSHKTSYTLRVRGK